MCSRLGWITQVDTHSCGPLAAAAAVLLLQGFRPTIQSLRMSGMEQRLNADKTELEKTEMQELRRRVLLIWMYFASGRVEPYT